MRYLSRGSVAIAVVALTGQALAADLRPYFKAPPIAQPWNWTGFYAGIHAGAALGFSKVSDPYGSSIFGDQIRTPAFLVGGQAGYNWQPVGSMWVFGVEGDVSWVDADGSNSCFAATGQITSSNCRARPDVTGALTGRIGLATGTAGRTLLYGKGGAAFLHNRLDATTNWGFGAFPITSTSADTTSWGWTVGAGVEQALSPAWSLKLEYDYSQFADATLTTPATFTTTPAGLATAVAPSSASIRQSMHAVKIGLNYHFDRSIYAQWPPSAAASMAAAATVPSAWMFEIGGRYWYSSGRFQKDLPATSSSSTSLISRLTYDSLTAHAGELYARVDAPWLIFVKGFVGAGRITGGNMNDEDWGLTTSAPFTGYSNTLSDLSSSNMNYQTVDLGFNLLNGPGYKVGPIIGYNRVHEQYAATDCTQIASPSSGICSPTISNTPVITETDTWQSLRLGLSGDIWLARQWRLTGDAAWLPYVKFTGVDNHWLRNLVIDESGTGRGVQLEAFISYYITPQFSVGIGGRYWAMWTTTGSDAFDGVPVDRTDTYRYERYGGLLQASYKFN